MEGRVVSRAFLSVVVIVCLLAPGPSLALGSLRPLSAEEAVTGAGGILGPLFTQQTSRVRRTAGLPDSAASRPGRMIIRVSEEQMYGIAGLHNSGVLAGAGIGRFFVTGEAAQMSSHVGKETRLAITAALHADGWAVSAGGVYDAVSLEGMAGANLTSLNASSLVWLTNALRVGGSIERVRISGEDYPGADVSLVLLAYPAAAVALYGTVQFDRRFGAVPGVAMILSGMGVVRFGVGYESGPGALKGSFTLSWRSVDVAVGVYYHPVLGEKREVALTWSG